jgi:hypothetical protein
MKDLGLPPAPSRFKPASELVNERLVDIYRTWRGLAGTRFAPARKDIAPARFKTALSNLFLVDVLNDGDDFRLALAGDTVIRFLGSEYKVGKLLSEVSPSPFHERSFRFFKRVVEEKAPVALGPVRTLHEQHGYFDNEAIVLPLSDAGQSVTGLMGVIHLSLAAFEAAQTEDALKRA